MRRERPRNDEAETSTGVVGRHIDQLRDTGNALAEQSLAKDTEDLAEKLNKPGEENATRTREKQYR